MSESDISVFDDPDGTFTVLMNDEQQRCLWPEPVPVPPGWTVTHGPARRDECLAHINDTWTDTRPRSLADWAAGPAAAH
ncbi:MbtH family protein [Catellatospora methionotrophica]|uniref:MbtH family protein n=1 Tax=Catellatospora methionotrophica TaxID=121620 RepID=UPI0023B33B53|nr:MbtH family protein [Catellatospora methionotrophica]